MSMRSPLVFALLLFIMLGFIFMDSRAAVTELIAEKEWTWIDKSGQSRKESDLKQILEQHARFISTRGNDGVIADLTSAKMTKATLRNAILTGATLANADLTYADLTNANLSAVTSLPTFQPTNLSGANLSNSILHYTNFNSAILSNANLSGSDLTGAQLNGANLSNAMLNHSVLKDTNLTDANLQGTDLYRVVFEARSTPKSRSIAAAKTLEYLTYSDDSEALARLRQQFKEGGFRDQERKITFALKSRQAELLREACETSKGNCLEYWINRVLFDLTSQYGMNPGRVLVIITVIFGVCTTLYLTLIHSSKTSGLSIIVPTQHNNQPLWLLANLNQNADVIEIGGFAAMRAFKVQPRELQRRNKIDYLCKLIRRESALLWVAVVFSLMSTFNIKFKDVDFGRWLKLLTTKEYDIMATGLARTVAGLQALLSVYFIALLLVTYFGRPFE